MRQHPNTSLILSLRIGPNLAGLVVRFAPVYLGSQVGSIRLAGQRHRPLSGSDGLFKLPVGRLSGSEGIEELLFRILRVPALDCLLSQFDGSWWIAPLRVWAGSQQPG